MMSKNKSLKPSQKEREVFSYCYATGEIRWCYRHRYYANGVRKEKNKNGFKTEKAAIRSLLEVKAALSNGHAKSIELESMTVSAWLDTWFEANKPHWRISTWKQYDMYIRLHFKPILGKMRLSQLERQTYQRVFINELLKTYSINSVKSIHTVFNVAINAAVEDDVLIKNRIKRVKISKPNVQEEQKLMYYTAEQLELFLKTAQEAVSYPVYMSFLLLSYTGMRRGELLALWHDDFNFINNTITVNKTRDGNGVRPPKTKNSYRIIPVDPAIMGEVKKYQTWTKKVALQYGHSWNGSDYAMRGVTGEVMSHGAFSYAMRKVQERSGLPIIPVHGLRHTHATLLMINPEITVKAISERLGNTVDIIYRIYGHVLEEMSYSTMLAFSHVMKQQKEALESVEQTDKLQG